MRCDVLRHDRRPLGRIATAFALGAALLAATFTPQAAAQTDFPNKPIRLIVPFAPGGLADITMRIVGEQLGERLGQRIVIDNRPSGGGIAAAQAVATGAG